MRREPLVDIQDFDNGAAGRVGFTGNRPPALSALPGIDKHRNVINSFTGCSDGINITGKAPGGHELPALPTEHFSPRPGIFTAGSLPDIVYLSFAGFFHRIYKFGRHRFIENRLGFRTVIAIAAEDARFILYLKPDYGTVAVFSLQVTAQRGKSRFIGVHVSLTERG